MAQFGEAKYGFKHTVDSLLIEQVVTFLVFHGTAAVESIMAQGFRNEFLGSNTDAGDARLGFFFTNSVDVATEYMYGWGKTSPMDMPGMSKFMDVILPAYNWCIRMDNSYITWEQWWEDLHTTVPGRARPQIGFVQSEQWDEHMRQIVLQNSIFEMLPNPKVPDDPGIVEARITGTIKTIDATPHGGFYGKWVGPQIQTAWKQGFDVLVIENMNDPSPVSTVYVVKDESQIEVIGSL